MIIRVSQNKSDHGSPSKLFGNKESSKYVFMNMILPLLLAAFFRLFITDGLMLSNTNRSSSPGYRDLKTKQKRWIYCKIQSFITVAN